MSVNDTKCTQIKLNDPESAQNEPQITLVELKIV